MAPSSILSWRPGSSTSRGTTRARKTAVSASSLIANFGDEDEANDKRYFASGGNVVVNSAGTRAENEITGNFTGTMSDVTLTELGEDGAPLAGGCSTTIEQATWDTPIENGD